MPAGGKTYGKHEVKVPAMPTASSSGKVKSGKVTASSYGQYKTMGTMVMARKEKKGY